MDKEEIESIVLVIYKIKLNFFVYHLTQWVCLPAAVQTKTGQRDIVVNDVLLSLLLLQSVFSGCKNKRITILFKAISESMAWHGNIQRGLQLGISVQKWHIFDQVIGQNLIALRVCCAEVLVSFKITHILATHTPLGWEQDGRFMVDLWQNETHDLFALLYGCPDYMWIPM